MRHTDNPNTDVGGGWGFKEKRLKCDYLSKIQLTNRLLVPPNGLAFDEDQDPENLFLGVGITAMPLFNGELRTDTASSAQGETSAYHDPWSKLWERNVWDISRGELSWTWTIDAAEFSGPMVALVPDTWFRDMEQFYASETTNEMYCGEAKYWGKPEMPTNNTRDPPPESKAYKHGSGETCDWCEPWCDGHLTGLSSVQ